MTQAEIEAIIATVAAGPASAENDGQKFTAQSLSDLMKVADRLATNAGADLKSRGLRFTRLAPPNAE